MCSEINGISGPPLLHNVRGGVAAGRRVARLRVGSD